jgi:Sulfatase-modifying factor enzyme 1
MRTKFKFFGFLILSCSLLGMSYLPNTFNDSECCKQLVAKGDALFKQGDYTKAKLRYESAKDCNDANLCTTAINNGIAKCNAKINPPVSPKPKDSDGDGYIDTKDQCPNIYSSCCNGCPSSSNKPYIEMVSIPGKNYKIAKYEVTIGQYLAYCKATNSHWPEWLEAGNKYNIKTGTDKYYLEIGMSESNTNYPITGVSWHDAKAFCEWMGGRLPTEEKWEYAAKGGQSYEYAGSNTIRDVAWYSENSDGKCHTVGGKKANGYGLYDMTGNVWEWTDSWYDDSKAARVLRGGSWVNYIHYCRLSDRYRNTPDNRNGYNGFRLALGL